MKITDITNWYWTVAGDAARAWSSASAGYVDVNDTAFKAWLAFGYSPTPVGSIAELRDVFGAVYPAGMLETYAAAKRYEKETGGITVAGIAVATDRQSQAMLSGAYAMALADAAFATQWKGADGTFVPLDASTIIAVAKAVGAHISACFSKEADIVAGITAGTIQTREAIDAAFAAM